MREPDPDIVFGLYQADLYALRFTGNGISLLVFGNRPIVYIVCFKDLSMKSAKEEQVIEV